MRLKSSGADIGFRGWFLILYGVCIFLVGGPFWASSVVNVTITVFAEQIGTTTAALLNVHTVVSVVVIVANFSTGVLFRKFSARVVNVALMLIEVIAIGCWVHSTTVLGYGISRFFILFGAQVVCQYGLGVVYSNYFPTKKGFVLGWATVGTSASNIVALPVLNALIPRLGLNKSFYVIAAWILLWALINLVFVPDDPAKVNFKPDNGAALPNAAVVGESDITLGQMVKNYNFWCFAIGYGLLTAVSAGFMAQLVLHLGNNGISQTAAVGYIAIVAVIGMISSAVSGIIDNVIGTRKTSIIVCFGYVAACLILGLVPFSMVSMFLALACFSCVMGAVSNVPLSRAIGAYGSHNFVKAQGLLFPIMATLSAPVTSILAFSLNRTGTYNLAYTIFGILAIIAFILVGIASADAIRLEDGKLVGYRVGKNREVRMGRKS